MIMCLVDIMLYMCKVWGASLSMYHACLVDQYCVCVINLLTSGYQKYEEEIKQLEAAQGNDVKFINPEV